MALRLEVDVYPLNRRRRPGPSFRPLALLGHRRRFVSFGVNVSWRIRKCVILWLRRGGGGGDVDGQGDQIHSEGNHLGVANCEANLAKSHDLTRDVNVEPERTY
jgi:hypothetical protein